jgi:hypothetical protein
MASWFDRDIVAQTLAAPPAGLLFEQSSHLMFGER